MGRRWPGGWLVMISGGSMSRRRISILGATGSIGASTVSVIESLGREQFHVVAVTGNSNVAALSRIACQLGAEIAVTADPHRLEELRDALTGTEVEAAAGPEALLEAAARPADWVMSAIVGSAGLAPTLAAATNGATIALANKECLVAAGELFLSEIARVGATLIPVDSEHNAIFQLVHAENRAPMERLILTASGGPFRTATREEMARASVAEAVAHPNWSMGARISIDSATMFNKALEMIEAHYLFDVAPERIEVVVHPQSVVHALIGFSDGALFAHLGPPDMRVAIGYALAWPRRPTLPVERIDLAKISRLDFEAPDPERFPALDLARTAMAVGGAMPCILNAAREVALDAFMEGALGFLDMAAVVGEAMESLSTTPAPTSLEEVLAVDAQARDVARALVRRFAA